MGEKTGIEWCDHTFSPWWGCTKVSEACTRCYAEAVDKRYAGGPDLHWGKEAPRRFFGDKHWQQPLAWNRAAEKLGVRRRVFCASMADVFEDREDLLPHRARLWGLIARTPHLDWLLLTKRPENFARMLKPMVMWGMPAPNVWLGVTAENQARAEERIPHLLRAPAVVRFVSYEPALGPLDLTQLHPCEGLHIDALNGIEDMEEVPANCPRIHWVIAGDESGRGARASELGWYRSVRDQCSRAGTAFFLKQRVEQVNGHQRKTSLPVLDGRQHHAFPAVATP
jgi:protein gp37